jgi:hypothetical protein
MPWQWRWNPDITCYTGTEYKEVLREKYGLPADWEPTEPEPIEWHPTGEWPHDWWKPTPPGGYEDRDEPSTSPEAAPEADD